MDSNAATVTIILDTLPAARPDTFTATTGKSLVLTRAQSLLKNDKDADKDPLTL